MKREWFAIDIKGLLALLDGKKKTFIINELCQNAFDENITYCKVNISHSQGKVCISVEDDSPEGFRHIEHAYTLFANTYKRGDPTKRGRFNIGEKLVLALCIKYGAEIITTKGTVEFHPTKGRIHHWSKKRDAGSIFTGSFRATKEEYNQLLEHTQLLLPPSNIAFIVNGKTMPAKQIYRSFETTLDTEILKEEIMRLTKRKTTVNLVPSDDQAYIFEMGIPITKTDCKCHIDVQQKIPLTLDRENVKEAYLQDLYAEVLNHTHDDLDEEEVSSIWVRTGTKDKRITRDAMDTVLKRRYGEKFLSANSNDPNANDEAISRGYHLISGAEMSKEEWDQAKGHDLIQSTTAVFGKTPVGYTELDPTPAQQRFATFIKKVAREVLNIDLTVKFITSKATEGADFDNNTIYYNMKRLPANFFDTLTLENLDLFIHELGHKKGNHPYHEYHQLITKLGAWLTMKALRNPAFFAEARHNA